MVAVFLKPDSSILIVGLGYEIDFVCSTETVTERSVHVSSMLWEPWDSMASILNSMSGIALYEDNFPTLPSNFSFLWPLKLFACRPVDLKKEYTGQLEICKNGGDWQISSLPVSANRKTNSPETWRGEGTVAHWQNICIACRTPVQSLHLQLYGIWKSFSYDPGEPFVSSKTLLIFMNQRFNSL